MSLWRRPRIILSKLGLVEHLICVFLCVFVCVERGTSVFTPSKRSTLSQNYKGKEKNSKAPSVYHFYLKKRKYVCAQV